MVGRALERAVLEELLAAGAGAVVLAGEPGIGKTRLLGWLAARARELGYAVVSGRATEYEDDLAFGPWREALAPHLAELGERRIARLGLTDAPALAAITGGEPAAPVDRHRLH